MKTKAFTLMRNDTENKKSRAGPFDMNGLVRFSLFLWKLPGMPAVSTDFWTLKNGKIYMGNDLHGGYWIMADGMTCRY